MLFGQIGLCLVETREVPGRPGRFPQAARSSVVGWLNPTTEETVSGSHASSGFQLSPSQRRNLSVNLDINSRDC